MNYVKVCFVGHKNVLITERLIDILKALIINLIEKENAIYFLFGDNSNFNDTCYQIVTELKNTYPQIKRVYFPAKRKINYEMIFDETYYLKSVQEAGKTVYVERNKIMINKSDICVFYYKKEYEEISLNYQKRNSGTKIAYNYAVSNKKRVINVTDLIKQL